MLHLANRAGHVPKDAFNLLATARQLSSNMNNVTVRDTRVSSKHLEFDISINKDHLGELVEKLKPIGNLDNARQIVEEKGIKKEGAIREGIFYFNNERFWECHEALEGVWNVCEGREKDLVQGIILVAAAFVHYQKNEDKICISVLGRAQEKLEKASGDYHNIDIEGLKNKIAQIRGSGEIATFRI